MRALEKHKNENAKKNKQNSSSFHLHIIQHYWSYSSNE